VPGPDLLHREPDSVPNRDLSTWGILETWDNEGDLNASQFAPDATSQDASELPVWAPSSILGPDIRSQQNFSDPVSQSPAELAKSEIWQTPDKLLEQPSLSDRSAFEGWSQIRDPEEQTIAQEQPLREKEAWEESNSLLRSDLAGVDLWKGEEGSDEMVSLSDTWSASSSVSGTPAPPSWLSMLTQQERLQMSGAVPSIPSYEKKDVSQVDNFIMPSVEPAPVQSTNSVASAQSVKPSAPAQPAKVSAPAQSSHDVEPSYNEEVPPLEEEESFFGPAWLKSLGASTIEQEAPQEPALLSSSVEVTPVPPVQELSAPQARSEQSADSATVINAATEREQKLLSTLEEIEQNLRSKGFVSLEPNSLATIAQKDVSGFSNNEPEAEFEATSVAKPYQDVDLSSALAELGNLMPQTEASSDSPGEPEVASTLAQTEEPEWMTALRSFHTPQDTSLPEWAEALQPSTPAAPQEPQQSEEPYWMAPMQPEPQKAATPDWMAALQSEPTPVAQEPQKAATPDWMAALQSEPTPVAQEPQKAATPDWMAALHSGTVSVPAPQESRKSQASNDMPAISRVSETPQPVRLPDTRPNRVPITPGPVFEPVSQSLPIDTGQLSRSLSAPHPEPLLENELETTMRRPAVRLQHLQQSRPTAHRDLSPRGQTVDRSVGKATEGQVNYKDYLLRGYQYQLSGDYDEAMQAYRLIIKGSPELLSEVVSNVRALLKLAPKYAAGYRVLGDAYMRQGEYLQAMESYNKALTMAKKARS
jgi:hypothetical protein